MKKIGRDIKRMLSAFSNESAAEYLSMSDKLKHLNMHTNKQSVKSSQGKSRHDSALTAPDLSKKLEEQ